MTARSNLSGNSISYSLQKNISEIDIIHLQELFLESGFHRIKIKDMAAARSITSTLLYSLNYYNEVACLSLCGENCTDSSNLNVYYWLLESGALEENSKTLEEQIIANFYADFLWIEESLLLVEKTWYHKFIKTLMGLRIDQHMPIIIYLQ